MSAMMDFTCSRCKKRFGIMTVKYPKFVNCSKCGFEMDVSADMKQLKDLHDEIIERESGTEEQEPKGRAIY